MLLGKLPASKSGTGVHTTGLKVISKGFISSTEDVTTSFSMSRLNLAALIVAQPIMVFTATFFPSAILKEAGPPDLVLHANLYSMIAGSSVVGLYLAFPSSAPTTPDKVSGLKFSLAYTRDLTTNGYLFAMAR